MPPVARPRAIGAERAPVARFPPRPVSKPESNLRLFVAAYPPVEISRAMLRTLEALTLPKHRAAPPAHVHLTLQFVGDVPSRILDDVIESVDRSAGGIEPFTLTPKRVVSLPFGGRPRLIAAETDAPASLMELQRRLAHRLARHARPRPGDRFLPHITLCRFAHDADRPARVDHPIAVPPFAVNEIRLMRSVLRPDGAEHFEVRGVSLSGS